MEVSVKSLIALLETVAEETNNAVAENVLMALRHEPDEAVQVRILRAVADGFGVSLV